MNRSVLFAAVIAGCSRGSATVSSSSAPPASAPADTNEAPWLDVFTPYRGVRHLCSEHVAGTGMHIEWSSYATTDAPAAVAAFYRERAKGYQEEKAAGDVTFAADADRKLTISAANGEYPKCAQAPAASEKTVIVVSRAIR